MDRINLTNTVDANNQLKKENYVRYGRVCGMPRILFAGNSMAWHAPKEDIGWHGDWGMAASCEDNDYVHQTMKLICKDHPEASYCIAQCAYWERNMCTNDVLDKYKDAASFNADAIVIILGENILESEYTEEELADKFAEFADFLRGNRKHTPVFMSKPFMWDKSKVSKAVDKAAKIIGASVMNMDELKNDITYRAIGRFDHSGVAAHPGNRGMKKIAEIIFENIRNIF